MVRQRGAKEISEERRQTILNMQDIRLRQCDIVQYYIMPQSTVSNIICRGRIPKITKNIELKMKLTSRATRTLLKTVSENKFQSSSVIASIYNKYSYVAISARAVRRTLKRNGIRNYAAASKPFLSSKNMTARYEWALNYKEWTDEQWDGVIFSEESTFTVRSTVLKEGVWHKPTTKYELCNLVPTFKSGYVCICV